MSIIELQDVTRTYTIGGHEINALTNISLELDSGFICVLGPSGSGKTTLLNVIGGIDRVTSGKIFVDDLEITRMRKGKLTDYRRTRCGFVFQFFNLLPIYNALENVEFAVELGTPKISRAQVTSKATEYLRAVGLEKKIHHFPSQLSGGEQQRVAAARAFAKEPQVLLCDEPTGELSVREGRLVLSVLQKMIDTTKKRMLVILVTHNQRIAEISDVVVRLRSGKIDSISKQEPKDAQELTW